MNLSSQPSVSSNLESPVPDSHGGEPLKVNVIYTGNRATLAALKAAGNLTRDLDVSISLVAAHQVPISFPVDRPPVARSFLQERLRDLAGCGAQGPLPTTVKLYLCRDRRSTLQKVLDPQSLVIIGYAGPWWRREEKILARALARDGHRVILIESRHRDSNAGYRISRDRHTFLHSLLGLHQGL